MRNLCWLLTFAATLFNPAFAADDFYYEMPLSNATTSLRSAELNWTVLSHLLQANQADIQVVNADNQAVPAQVREVSDLRALTWQGVTLHASDKPQQFRLDIPPSVPVSQWRMRLDAPGSAYEGVLYTRFPASQRYGEHPPEWLEYSRFRHYSLQTAEGEVHSNPDNVPTAIEHEWRLDFTRPNPLPMNTSPVLELGWKPLEIRFIAQGKAPFRLRYGSLNAQNTPVNFDDRLDNASAESVTLGAEKQLAPLPTPLVKPVWTRWLLWGILTAAVCLLLWMAHRLWLEMERNSPQ